MDGFMDKAKKRAEDSLDQTTLDEKAQDFASEHSEQVDQGVDRASEFVDEKTGGKYSDQIDQGADRLRDFGDNGNQDEGNDNPDARDNDRGEHDDNR